VAANDPASLPGEAGEGNDLSEFDDLLDSLRDAMRSAEEDRSRGRKRGGEPTIVVKRPQTEVPPGQTVPGGAAAAKTEYPQAEPPGAEGAVPIEEKPERAEDEEDGYPDWLTNGSSSETEGRRIPEKSGEPEGPGELEWPGEPYVDLPSSWDQPSLTKRRHVYRSYESSRISAHAFRCRVTLSTNGHEYVGEAEGPSVPGVRAEIAAKATLDALCSAENGRVILSLMTARVLRFSDMPLVVVSVYGMNEEEINRLVGVSVVENSEEQAAILATLQATDRWIAGVISRAHD
jgi:hypothetical protein